MYGQQNKWCVNSISTPWYYINFLWSTQPCELMVVRIRNTILRYIIPPLHVSQQSATGWYATRVYRWWRAVGLPGYSSRQCYHWRNLRGQPVAANRWPLTLPSAARQRVSMGLRVKTRFASIETTQHAWRGLFEQIKRLSSVLSTCSMWEPIWRSCRPGKLLNIL